ncbi:MAG TPA: hypothetical protein VIE42_03590 [Steroidobacteraceae bacterium]|jgi:hypothetical protein
MYGIVGKHGAVSVLGVVAVAIAVAGCDGDAASAGIRQTGDVSASESGASLIESILPDWYPGERPALRYRLDTVRGRLWVMTLGGIELYDIATRRKVAQIALPEWIWAGEPFSCSPDLAVGPAGEAVVSSDVVPTLWRVDPDTLAVSRHELVLDEDRGRDVGFTGLVYSAQQQAFFAVSSFQGSLWRIDPLLRRAQNIPLSAPLPDACGLALRPRAADERASWFVGFCVRADQGDWLVNLAPDQRSGYVRSGYCGS